MDHRSAVLSLLFLAVLASGCINSGQDTKAESRQSITVQELSVEPKQVYQGTSVRASVEVKNTGNLPAEISLGKEGKRVLKDQCQDIFSIGPEGSDSGQGFRVVTSGEEIGDSRIALEPGQELRLSWKLNQVGDVPLYGLKCNLKFELPFEYSVSSFRQVQIKKSREVEGSPKLASESSSGPLLFAIETIGSTTGGQSTFVAPDTGGRTVTVLFQLQNKKREGFGKGVVDVKEETLEVEASPPLELREGFVGSSWQPLIQYVRGSNRARCNVDDGEEITLFEGKSRVISCDVPLPEASTLDSPSVISEVTGSVEYEYLKDVGTRTVEVKNRGQ